MIHKRFQGSAQWLLMLVVLGTAAVAGGAEAPAPAAAPTPLFALLYRTGPSWVADRAPQEQPHFAAHSRHLRRLRESGAIVLGARYADTGFLVLRAADDSTARAMVQADTAIVNGLFRVEVQPLSVFYPGCLERPAR